MEGKTKPAVWAGTVGVARIGPRRVFVIVTGRAVMGMGYGVRALDGQRLPQPEVWIGPSQLSPVELPAEEIEAFKLEVEREQRAAAEQRLHEAIEREAAGYVIPIIGPGGRRHA